jgi:hypothetical protein
MCSTEGIRSLQWPCWYVRPEEMVGVSIQEFAGLVRASESRAWR